MDDLEDYFWEKPTSIRTYYNMRMLGYVNMTCVTIGLPLNIFMICVFTRKNMISPINTIFTHYIGILTAFVLSYIPRTYHEFFRVQLCAIPEHNTNTWEHISYYSYCLTFITRHISIWLAMMLAVWRYIAVIHPLKERRYCNMQITRILIVAGYVFNFCIAIPPFMGTSVGPSVKLLDQDGCATTNYTIGKNITIYELKIPHERYILYYTCAVFSYSIFLKLLPSFILTAISIKLINNLRKAKKRRQKLICFLERKNTYNSRMERQIIQNTERTTKILVVVLALFVMGEVPHGMFSFLTAWYGPKFFWKYYYYAMEVFNSCTFIAETFNFVVYYSMSRQFRSTFKALFINNSNLGKIVTPQRSSSSLPGVDRLQDSSTRSSSVFTINSSCM